ncbi:hypothetical protein [Polymorphospora rubra]|nr:hypothetical protein [Polymorphospora rubra]
MWLENTGTPHTEPVSRTPDDQPGNRVRPNQYCVPSDVVNRQCSLL